MDVMIELDTGRYWLNQREDGRWYIENPAMYPMAWMSASWKWQAVLWGINEGWFSIKIGA